MSHSMQYQLLKKLWESSHAEITPAIISMSEQVLEQFALGKHHCGCPNKSGTISMNDELWYPLDDIKAGKLYRDYLGEHGNEDDECQLLSSIWVLVLAKTGKAEYMPIIAHLADVEINGL